QKKLIMLPSETMIWQPEFTDKTLSRKPGAVHFAALALSCIVLKNAALARTVPKISPGIFRFLAH
ncbi:hypothetical protein, partial [Escherichia coli]|uniref:hypothetical protein n=1 Tax=Escherichia coli TaxID=562 RepID=UPI001B8B4DFE